MYGVLVVLLEESTVEVKRSVFLLVGLASDCRLRETERKNTGSIPSAIAGAYPG
jgi:hypothetical protein